MKKIIQRSLLTLLTISSMAYAEVREINRYSEVTQQLGQAQLVIFDIDNTLLRPLQSLGSDQWFDDRVKRHLNEGLPLTQAIDTAIQEWTSVQSITGVQLTDRSLPSVFAMLKDMGIPIIGLTARPIELIDTSTRQLLSAGLSFFDNTINAAVSDFQGAGGPALFRNGVLFVGAKNNKGLLLKSFFESNGLRPQSIAFFDDKAKHVNIVEAALSGTGIKYTGYRYGAMDAWVKSFNAAETELNYQKFLRTGALYPDSKAGDADQCEAPLQRPSFQGDFDRFLQQGSGI